MKRVIFSCILVLLVFTCCGFSWYYSTKVAVVVPYKVKINGTELQYSYGDIVTIDDSIYIPLRAVAEKYGATVEWNEKEKEATIEFTNELTPFCKDGKWGLVKINSEIVVDPKYTHIYDFNEGLALVNNSAWTAKYGYINERGEEVIECQYSHAGDFSEGLSLVAKAYNGEIDGFGEKCFYFIDKNGEDVFGKQFKYGYDFSEGYAPVVTEGEIAPILWELYPPQWEYIDTTGEIVSKEKYDEANSFRNGYAVVKKDGVWKIINNSFEYVSELEFENQDDAFRYIDSLEKDRGTKDRGTVLLS